MFHINFSPFRLAFPELESRVDWQVLKFLDEAARPPNLKPFDSCRAGQTEVLLVGHTAEITAARDQTVLFAPTGKNRHARADCRTIASGSLETHVQEITSQNLRIEDVCRQ